MPVLDKSNAQEVERYNQFMRQSAYNHAIQQDIMWAHVKEGWDDYQVYVEEDGEIVGAMSILARKVIGNYTMMYAAKGPVCDLRNTDIVSRLVQEADEIAKQTKAFVLRFDPEVEYDQQLEQAYKDLGFKVRNEGFGKNELIQPRYNMVLSLENEDADSLFKKLSRSKRRNINLAARKGVQIKYSQSEDDLQKFYELYKETTERQQMGRRPYEYFVRMLEAYPENVRIYTAAHEGDVLAAALSFRYVHKVTYVYGASSALKRELKPNDLMQWEMIKWALETNAHAYDFGGVFQLDRSDGLYEFKEGFCRKDGVTAYIGEIDQVYHPFVYYTFTQVLPKAQKIKKKLARA